MERVILVDEQDRERGSEEKIRAHVHGELHRAFSVFLFDARGRLLLQQRAAGKYHSAGLWANTCCGHPRPQEGVLEAARRRLREELGVECELRPAFQFVYRAALGGGLTEHELDHVLVGDFSGVPRPDPQEVAAWRWESLPKLARDVRAHPERYAAWFPIALEGVLSGRASGRRWRARPATGASSPRRARAANATPGARPRTRTARRRRP